MLVNNNSIEGGYTESCKFESRRGSFFDFPLIIIIIMKTNKYFPFNIFIIMCYTLMLQEANHRFTGRTSM